MPNDLDALVSRKVEAVARVTSGVVERGSRVVCLAAPLQQLRDGSYMPRPPRLLEEPGTPHTQDRLRADWLAGRLRLRFRGPQPANAEQVLADGRVPIRGGFMYTCAPIWSIPSIARGGLRPQPDGTAARFTGVVTTWWGAKAAWVLRYHIYGTVLLRTSPSNGHFLRTAAAAPEFVCHAGVAADRLEYLGIDRQWHALRLVV